MIRIRSKKLLSGVSTLAVMAAFGAADPALAGQTITAAGNPNPPVTNTVSDDFIDIQAGSLVLADTGGVSLFNSGTLTSFVNITNATLNGGISNTGSITGSAINIVGSSIGGAISNTGLIEGGTEGIFINNSIINGAISNSGTAAIIQGQTDGILLTGNSIVTGGITNEGTIIGFGTNNADGIAFEGAGVVVIGGITNASTGTIQALVSDDGVAINLSSFTALVGDIDNSGRILSSGATTSIGINMQTGVLAGSIINREGGRIVATSGTGINIAGGTVTGNIDNSGTIRGDNGVLIGGVLAGSIVNQSTGSIIADGVGGIGVGLNGGTIAQGLDNQGVISATNTSGIAISIAGATFSGGISNTGTIQASNTAILINGATFTGGITNSGVVTSANSSGIAVFGTDLNGDFVNDADGLINAGNGAGFSWTGTDFTGSVLNDGAITAFNQGIIMLGTGTITGDITNNGDITGSTAIALIAPLIDGSVTNTGNLTATANGITLNGTITGDVTNDGNIAVGATGIFLSGLVQGALSNGGDITAGTGLNITGQVVGGISNSGNILATNLGINLSGATAGHTITQTAGSIAAPTALFMVNGDVDTFIGSGGVVGGNINGDTTDSFGAAGSGTFAYSNGTATGIFHFDNDGTGLFVLGSSARGIDGAGVTVTADHMYGNGVGAQFYLDDDTTITLNDFNVGTGDLIEFHVSLPAGVEDAGFISTAAGTITGANVGAFIDPATMAAAPIPTTSALVYNNVISAGALTGTFANSGTILTSSPFFTGFAQYDGDGTVDLILNRLAFGDVLVAESHNQIAVGNALETIYTAGGYSGDLQDVFEALFDAATTAEVQAMLIELSGSQHAQVGQAVNNLTNSINGMVRERLDSVLISQDGVRWSGTPGQQYAQAVAVASDAASSGLRGSQGMTRGASGWSVWGRAFENENNVDTDADASGYDHDSQGGIVGVDYALSPNETIGASIAYATSDMWFDASPDTADIESWQANVFGSYGFGRFYVDAQGSYAWHDIGTLRSIDLPAPAGSDIATAGYDASSWSVNGELGAIWRLGRVNVQPSLAVAYIDSSASGFTETSPAGYALIVSGAEGQSLSTTLALRASGQWMMAKTPVVPDFKIGWRHEYLDDNATFDAAFIDDPSVVMSIVSSQVKADSLVVSSGATFGVTKNFEVFFDVNGQYNADASLTNASGGVRVTW
ncbi:MAG: autotransporter domain-containing protein [Alphaproteobacteria bacterium]|nr:autotransporter domain-containing protein [Alphaproteobacteria bacterium]